MPLPCGHCHRHPRRPGRATCAPCAESAAHHKARRHAERLAQKLCTRCGAHPHDPGHAQCAACRLAHKLAVTRLLARKEARGECDYCPQPRTHGPFCAACHAKQLARNRLPNPRRILHCSECGEARHNARTCPNAQRAA